MAKAARGSLAILTAGLLAAGASAAANVLVVRSSGPSAGNYPPGRSLPDSAAIALGRGDMVMILGQSGTRTFTGPGTFSANGPVRASGPAAAYAGLGRRQRLGASRDPLGEPRTPSVWHVDATRSGNVCLKDMAQVSLWRPDASRAARLTIGGSGEADGTFQWSEGQATFDWPATLPVAPGTEYRLHWEGAAEPVRLRFAALGAAPEDAQQMAGALIANGCQAQLDRLIADLPKE